MQNGFFQIEFSNWTFWNWIFKIELAIWIFQNGINGKFAKGEIFKTEFSKRNFQIGIFKMNILIWIFRNGISKMKFSKWTFWNGIFKMEFLTWRICKGETFQNGIIKMYPSTHPRPTTPTKKLVHILWNRRTCTKYFLQICYNWSNLDVNFWKCLAVI